MQTELVDYVVKEGGVSNSVIQTNCTVCFFRGVMVYVMVYVALVA